MSGLTNRHVLVFVSETCPYRCFWSSIVFLNIIKMSIVPKETIEVIAQSIGINNLSQDAAEALAPDVEYRMREIMQVFHVCSLNAFRHFCF